MPRRPKRSVLRLNLGRQSEIQHTPLLWSNRSDEYSLGESPYSALEQCQRIAFSPALVTDQHSDSAQWEVCWKNREHRKMDLKFKLAEISGALGIRGIVQQSRGPRSSFQRRFWQGEKSQSDKKLVLQINASLVADMKIGLISLSYSCEKAAGWTSSTSTQSVGYFPV